LISRQFPPVESVVAAGVSALVALVWAALYPAWVYLLTREYSMPTENHEQILTELRNEHQTLLAFGDALDAKLNTLFCSGSLIIGLFATLGSPSSAPVWYWLVIIGITICYLGSLIWAGAALQPTRYTLPIRADWNHIAQTYLPLPITEQICYLISQHLVAIAANERVLVGKARAAKLALWLLLSALVLLLANRLLLTILA
jgi:hypothetical protein